MQEFRLARYGVAIAAVLFGGVAIGTPAMAQLPSGAVQGGLDATRINSPSQDFFNRGRREFEDEIRLLNRKGGIDTFDSGLLTIDESLEHENWLYPLEGNGEPDLEVEIRVVPPTERIR